MKRLLALFAVAGSLAIPAVASAEPQYVYLRYGNGQPYVYVTTEPRPYHPYTLVTPVTHTMVTPATPSPGFDSQVGAACGTTNTDVYFGPSETHLDSFDRTTLSNLGYCLSRGPAAGASIEIVVGIDGTARSLERSYTRQGQVMEYLTSMGVRPSQIRVSRELAPGWQSDRIRFRFSPNPAVWPYL